MSKIAAAKKPSAKAIDDLILRYNTAEQEVRRVAALLRGCNEAEKKLKDELIPMVQAFGVKHAEKSRRLTGDHNQATITTGTRISVVAAAVEKFRAYLGKKKMPQLQETFFIEHVSYELVKSPGEVLKTVDVPKTVRTRMSVLLGLCFKPETNAPSLKVEVVTPVVPA